MRRTTEITIVWFAVVIIIISLISFGLTSENSKSTTTPLGLGIGLVAVLITFGIIMSVIILKMRSKYIYDWYPEDKI